ncbi:alpha/beta hydrolase [Desulfosporosinus sp. FKA]|uniref:alpha/beta fold hydrolase n=1 Tax=Desulfosporosinus sp. FKA TaxID=1969834 RepID=UPI000B497809|nr:alpha/beta hydrolase [Desulfosporosinus sp. FKA]
MPYASVKGINIFYESTGGDFLPLVVIHGAGGSSQSWSKQISGLQEQGNLIALDLPGHGKSGGSLLADIPSMADFLNDFVQTLGIEKFFLAGHSMGGAIAQEFTLRYPRKVTGLILLGTGARLRVGQGILDAAALGMFPFKNVDHLYGSATSDEEKAKEMKELQKIPANVFWADFQACNTFNRIDDAEKIQVSTLIVVGEEDVMTPVKYSRFLADKLPNTNLRIIKGAGHMCMQEKAAEVNEIIWNFLENSRV